MADGRTSSADYRQHLSNLGKYVKPLLAGLAALIFCLSVTTTVASVFEYFRLKEYYTRYQDQRADLSRLKKTVEIRNSQIKDLSEKLSELETRFAELSAFEKSIRDISRVEHFASRLPEFGIGGELSGAVDPEEVVWEPSENLVQCIDGRMERLNDAAARRCQSMGALFEILKTQQEVLAVTPSIMPVEGGWVSSRFGYRKSPFTSHREYHTGVDFAIRHGSPVRATADGVIKYAGNRGTLGKTVVIDHGYGIVTRYAHLSKLLVTEKQEISKGDVIAESGNTGRSTGPHLHYEVRFNGIPMNAEMYMPQYLAENTTD